MTSDTSIIKVSTSKSSQTFKWIQNTPEEISAAQKEGYVYRSIYGFSSIPHHQYPAPFIFGDLWLVTHDSVHPSKGIETMRNILDALQISYKDINLDMLGYYLDNQNTVFLRIPSVMFGGEAGHPLLPIQHWEMAQKIVESIDEPSMQLAIYQLSGRKNFDHISNQLLLDVYDFGHPFMFLPPGIVHKGNFTVEVDYDSFMHKRPASLFRDIKEGYEFSHGYIPSVLTSLCELYDSIIFDRCSITHLNKLYEGISLCPFFRSCMAQPEKVSKEKQEILFDLLALLQQKGLKIALEFGENMPDCSISAIRKAFIYSTYSRSLVTCGDVAHVHGCDGNCGVHTPYDLIDKDQSGAGVMGNYQERPDGLYYSLSGWEPDAFDEIRVCSPIFTTGRICNIDGTGWKREIVVEDMLGNRHNLHIPNSQCMKNNIEHLLESLCNCGLELSSHPKAALLLKKYFREAAPVRIMVGTKDLGWHEKCYVLPDRIIGHYDKKPVYLGDANPNQTSGTLADWMTRIGYYCKGNSLPMLLVQFALTGPLLRLCGMEGCGVHLYGPSSVGKTTCAHIGGSVCGGRKGRGNFTQWNTTPNALENTAAQHNDNLLVIDEIGEASAETVFKAIYMLTNGQGKERLKADTTARKAKQWLLNYLSTGEKPTVEKIEEDRKYQAMAGQEVRSINLPILGLSDDNVFTELHGFPTPAALSDHLKSASREVYGTLLRAFLEKLCGRDADELHAHTEATNQEIDAFIDHVCPKGASGQVYRVAMKFGLIAAAGIFAAKHSLLPWSGEEAREVAEKWFKIWIKKRGSIGNLEVEKAVKSIRDYWERYKESRFCDLDNQEGRILRDISGYYWREKGEVVFFLKTVIFNDLIGSTNRNEVLQAMQKKGILLTTRYGSRMETKSINGQNERGVGFKPGAWLGKSGKNKLEDMIVEDHPASSACTTEMDNNF